MSTEELVEPVKRLTKDLKQAATTMTADEARYLVDSYYMMQGNRIRSGNQIRSLSKNEEPHTTIAWLEDNANILENNIKAALGVYAAAAIPGKWAQGIYGIGPVISAGLLAHIVMEPWICAEAELPTVDELGHVQESETKACTPAEPHSANCRYGRRETAGQIWRFAGLDPTSVWEKGERRPWNASLKTLCWKIGESFVKVSGREGDVYGHLYVTRKEYETRQNLAGALAEQAAAKLVKFKIGKGTDAYLWYSGSLTVGMAQVIAEAPSEKRVGLARKLAGAPGSGLAMLPPAHIHARAKRWAVKLFLAHYHAVAYRAHFGVNAPKPYILTPEGGHVHEILCPDWPFAD